MMGGAGAPCSPPQLCRSPLQIIRKPKSGYFKLLGSPMPSSAGESSPTRSSQRKAVLHWGRFPAF